MELFLSAFFWFSMAVAFACLEIEAEGKYGWAEKMPTWYRTTGVVARIYAMLMGGQPLTGYHSFMFFIPILIFHSQFLQGVEWTVRGELLCWALYFAWFPLWDYLWFVLNPHYTIKHFRKRNVWWHSGSLWILDRIPIDYVIGWGVSIVLATAAVYVGDQDLSLLENHGWLLAWFTGLTCLLILVAPKYHRWYQFMRQKDDRDKAPISHRLND